MDPVADTNTNSNTNTDTNTETPRQEPPRTCTRTSRCAQQDCSICCTPLNHVRNLDAALNNNDGSPDSPTSMTTTKSPLPPTNHHIQILTAAFQEAILDNNIFELTAVDLQYSSAMRNDQEFLKYDRSELKLVHKQAQ